jgi:large subunit ribosomal protein L29
MKDTKTSELRAKTVPELEEMLLSERASLFKTRRDLVFRQIVDVKSLSVRRHNIARINTLITEKKRGGAK